MDDDIYRWLADQFESNDPARAGFPGAVRVIDGLSTLQGGHGTVFGLSLPAGASPERVNALLEVGRAMMSAWAATIDEETKDGLFTQFGVETLRAAGLELTPPPAPEPKAHVVCTFEVTLTKLGLVDDGEEEIRDAAVLAVFDGVGPEQGFESIVDLPVFMDLEWLLDASVKLRFDAGALVCELTLESDRPVDDAMLAAARAVGPELWESGWSLNLEWEHRDAPGFGPDDMASFFVRETARAVHVQAL